MNCKWTDHIKKQLKERKIPEKYIEEALADPDKIVNGVKKRKIHQKIIGDRLLRVITDNNILITAYFTDKIKKYMGE